ncbi:aspartyl protease family protein [Niabella ginsengisoli]|uniref:Aspartyl protease family protein n=1 Tax=Niabella ginsengisoli TaxID=522298 RepID=A0ABS9SPP9_9BACT|nr:aspartyl protease family protein [Niabella ginsengisoli]MCH5600109.1 aspartyl protease family protein [Niabella ginsengisoli]
MKKIALLILVVFFAHIAMSQEEFIDPPSRELTKIRFMQFTGGVIVFKALLDNFEDSLTFVLDTGSGGISLDSTTVSKLGLQPSSPERMIRGIGGTAKVGFLKNRKLTLNDLIIDSLNFHIIDYEILSALYGEKIDGIVGYAVLSRYIVKIDYENNQLTFCSNGTIKYPKGGYIMKPRMRTIPFLSAEVGDATKHDFSYLFDIGAGLTVLFSQDYMDDKSFQKKKRKRYLKQGEGLGGKVAFQLSVMKELKIGPYKFRNVPINIFDDEHNITSYPTNGGLIGNDIFRRFNCILNYKSGQIYLSPNKSFREPFDYAYSGLELYFFEGRAIVGDIPKGSPADKAGLMAGDEVLAVNKKFGMTLTELKHALMSTYGVVQVIVQRNDELLEKKMNVINILSGKAIPNQTLSSEFRDGYRIHIRHAGDAPNIKF